MGQPQVPGGWLVPVPYRSLVPAPGPQRAAAQPVPPAHRLW